MSYEPFLYHYGVKGMKWGVRRYQDKDGTISKDKRAKAKAEYKADNKKAFQLGKDATIKDYAYYKAYRKYEKKPTEHNKKVRDNIKRDRDKALAKAKAHVDELKKKYGKEAIKDLAYDKNGVLNARVMTGKEIATNVLVNAAIAGTAALLTGFPMIIAPAESGRQAGAREYIANEEKKIRTQANRGK